MKKELGVMKRQIFLLALFSFLFIPLILFAPPPMSRAFFFTKFLGLKIPVPDDIAGVRIIPEDQSRSYRGTGNRKLNAKPGTTATFWYTWGDGDSSTISDPFQTAPHQWWDSGIYTVTLYAKYMKRTYARDFTPVDTDTTETLAAITVLVSVHSAEPGGKIYFFVSGPSSTPEDTSVTFTANGIVDYAKEIPERITTSDFFNGVRLGSVNYRWKITRPTGFAQYEDPGWTPLLTADATVTPLNYTFSTPFDPQKYMVTLQVKYREQAWMPVYNSGVITAWVDDPNYQDNAIEKNCQNVALNSPVREFPGNILKSGQTPFETLITDLTPAVLTLENGPSAGTTGDPLENFEVTAMVFDNNPNAIFSNPVLPYDYYIEGSKRTLNKTDTQLTPDGAEIRSLSGSSITVVDPRTGTPFEGAKARYKFFFGRTENYGTRMPDDYAITMANYGPGLANHALNYFSRITVTDGATKPSYDVQSVTTGVVTVSDNDAPELSVTLKVDTPFQYSVTKGVRDVPGASAPIDINLNGTVFSNAVDPFKMVPSLPIQVVTPSLCPTFFVGQRVPVLLTTSDNVNGTATTQIFSYTIDGNPINLVLSSPFISVEKMPAAVPLPCEISAQDSAGNRRTIQFNAYINEFNFNPRVIETKFK